MKKIVVLFSGEGSNLSYILDNLHRRRLEVVAAITDNPIAAGIRYAQEASVPVKIIDPRDHDSRDEFDKVLAEHIKVYAPDLTVLAGFMRILGPAFTDNIQAVNLHPSLLPRHKGLNAIEKSYYDEHPDGGVSVHWVSTELDGGEIIRQKSITKAGLSLEQYKNKIKSLEKKALIESIIEILGIK